MQKEPKRIKVFINDVEYWINEQYEEERDRCIYNYEFSRCGTNINDRHISKNEREQVLNFIKYSASLSNS